MKICSFQKSYSSDYRIEYTKYQKGWLVDIADPTDLSYFEKQGIVISDDLGHLGEYPTREKGIKALEELYEKHYRAQFSKKIITCNSYYLSGFPILSVHKKLSKKEESWIVNIPPETYFNTGPSIPPVLNQIQREKFRKEIAGSNYSTRKEAFQIIQAWLEHTQLV